MMDLLTKLLQNRLVRETLSRKAVVLVSGNFNSFFFIVIDRYYQKFEIKIDKVAKKVVCSNKECIEFNPCPRNGVDYCWHVRSVFAWLCQHGEACLVEGYYK